MQHAAPMSQITVELPSLGLTVTPMTDLQVVNWIAQCERKALLLNHNLHSAYLFQRDARFREVYRAATRTIIDGAPILFLARRRAKNLSADFRIGSTDWLARLSDGNAPGRLFVYGATKESNDKAIQNLQQSHGLAGWEVAGIDGYVDQEAAIERMKSFRPTLVIVGLGMPLQERFLSEHFDELPTAVYATVGGAIDYVAGETDLSPRWVGRWGMEWAWRLAHDPARLAGRYLIEPFKLLVSIARKDRVRSKSSTESR